MANNTSFFKRLLNFFKITTTKKDNNLTKDKKTLTPADTTKNGNIRRLKFPSELQKLYDMWLKDNFDTSDSLKNREERYKDLDYMYYNNTIMSMATELYADETVQSDSQNQYLIIEGENTKVEKYITDFFDKIGVNQELLRSTAFDICLYGDALWVNSSDAENGIYSVTPLDVYSLKERIEFNAISYLKNGTIAKNKKLYTQLKNREIRLQKLLQDIESTDINDYSKYYDSYLFGFDLGNEICLPPWNVSHFRRFTTKSEFFPYGRPLFINCIAPYRQLQASKNLMALARAKKFPIEVFEVEVDDNMSPVEKWQAINEAKEEYNNLTAEEAGKEQFSVGGQIWTAKNLLNYQLFENRINLNDIADIELLRDDLIMGTRVPKGYLIVDRASFGTSGQALLQQFKPFGRAVYTIQTALLDELIKLVKLQFAMTGDFDVNTKFEISMNFPVVEESSDRLRIKSDTLRLANDVISNLTSALGLDRGEALPIDIVRDIFGQVSFLDKEDVNNWLDIYMKDKESEEMQEDRKKKIKERLSIDIIKESVFRAKKKNKMEEGVMNKRHFISSFKTTKQFDTILKLFDKDNMNGKIKG